MILFIPVSHKDVERLPLQLALFTHFGGLENHQVHIMGERQVGNQCQHFANDMRDICPKVEVSVLDFDPASGWPQAPNEMWFEAVKLFAQYGRQPVYFYELDSFLLQRGGIDAIEHEYKLSSKPYMGAVVPSRKFRWEPAGVPREQQKRVYYEEGTHMVGAGVYAADVFGRLKMWKYCKLARDPFNNPIAFDHYQGDELKRNGLHATKLIQHRWSTQNYRMEGNQIVCDNISDNPYGTDHSGPVDPKAVVLHGCKDESLARLVMEGPVREAYQEDRLTLSTSLTKQLRETYGGDVKIIDAIKMLETVSIKTQSEAVEEFERRMENAKQLSQGAGPNIASQDLKDALEKGIKNVTAPYPVPILATTAISAPSAPDQADPPIDTWTSSETAAEGVTLLDRAKAQLEGLGQKKCVLSQLASTLRVDKEELRAVLNADGSGWRVDEMGPGWIRRAQLQEA